MEPKPFLKTRYRVIPKKQAEGDHWLGGPAYHKGATCPNCKIPLLLLWDINCKDPRFPRRKFGPLSRLPFYFCWGCVSPLDYRIISPDEIRVLTSSEPKTPSFPYDPYPETFERRPVDLVEGTPAKVQQALRTWDMENDCMGQTLTDAKRKVLSDYFGHSIDWPIDLFHQQFGGVPLCRHWCWQELDSKEVMPCFKEGCRGSIFDRLRGKPHTLKFLAGIINDPLRGLPMVEPPEEVTKDHENSTVSVQFNICDVCWTISAWNVCD